MIDILISGFFGFHNSGDDAILFAMLEQFYSLNKNLRITVLSKNPSVTEEVYKVSSIYRFNIFKIIATMKKTRLFISGGGSLIQDVTSTRSLIYYLGLIMLAKLCGAKVMLYANGIGPVNLPFNKFLTNYVLNNVDLITLRDELSLNDLKKIGVTKPKIVVTADPAILLNHTEINDCSNLSDCIKKIDFDKPIICFSVRKWGKYTENCIKIIAKTADYIAEKYNAQTLLMPLHMSEDLDICKKIGSLMTNPFIIQDKLCPVKKLLGLIRKTDLLIGMRLHSLIYAASMEVPVVGIVYDTKVEGFLKLINQNYFISIENLNYNDFINIIEKVLDNKVKIQNELIGKMNELRENAKQNTMLAMELL